VGGGGQLCRGGGPLARVDLLFCSLFLFFLGAFLGPSEVAGPVWFGPPGLVAFGFGGVCCGRGQGCTMGPNFFLSLSVLFFLSWFRSPNTNTLCFYGAVGTGGGPELLSFPRRACGRGGVGVCCGQFFYLGVLGGVLWFGGFGFVLLGGCLVFPAGTRSRGGGFSGGWLLYFLFLALS